MNVLTCVSALSCADREAGWSELSGQGRALLRSGGLQQQRRPPPLSGTGLLPYRVSSHSVHPGLQSLRKRTFLRHLQAIPSPKHHVWAGTLCILSGASLRTASREHGGQTFAVLSQELLCSLSVSHREERVGFTCKSIKATAAAEGGCQRPHHGSKPAFNSPTGGKACLSARSNDELFGNGRC